MAVSKHNLWKRQKNGLMKLARSHKAWKKQQNLVKARTEHIKSGVHTTTITDKSTRTAPVVSNKSATDSQKRTQIGKKI